MAGHHTEAWHHRGTKHTDYSSQFQQHAQARDPLRSRCAYLYFEYPTIEQELEILKLRLGTDPLSSYAQIAGLAKALRSYRLLKPPSIREILKLAQVLRDRGCTKITPDMRDTLLPFLVKTAEDREKMLLTHNFNRLCADAANAPENFWKQATRRHPLPPRLS